MNDQDTHWKENERYIPISKIDTVSPNRKARARTDISPSKLQSLAFSIQEKGLMNAIVVTESNVPGRYTLVAGERRLEAHKYLKYEQIRCKLRSDLDEIELRELELTENVQRSDLSYQDMVRALGELYDLRRKEYEEKTPVALMAFNRYSRAQFASDTGHSEATISNYLALYEADRSGKYPGILEKNKTLTEAIRSLRRYNAQVPEKENNYLNALKELLQHGSLEKALNSIEPASADVLILESEDLILPNCWASKLAPNGIAYIFTTATLYGHTKELIQAQDLHTTEEPYVLHLPRSEQQVHFYLYCSPNSEIKPPPKVKSISAYSFETQPFHKLTKPYDFYATLLKTHTSQSLIVAPETYSLSLARVCKAQDLPAQLFCPDKDLITKMLINTDPIG